jgi:hypothetical protein
VYDDQVDQQSTWCRTVLGIEQVSDPRFVVATNIVLFLYFNNKQIVLSGKYGIYFWSILPLCMMDKDTNSHLGVEPFLALNNSLILVVLSLDK